MVFGKIGVISDILRNGFGGGGIVSAFGKCAMFFCPLEKFFIHHEMMNEAPNIGNRNGVKWVYTFEPVTIEIEHFFIKRGIISECPFYFKGFEISCHCLGNIAEFIHNNFTGAHSLYINRAFLRIISRCKGHCIMPYLLHDKLTLYKRFSALTIGNKIADIVTKRLFKGSCFRVENTNIHFSISIQKYYKDLPSFSLHYLLYQIFRKCQGLFSKK